jgi:hypothetical protein
MDRKLIPDINNIVSTAKHDDVFGLKYTVFIYQANKCLSILFSVNMKIRNG